MISLVGSNWNMGMNQGRNQPVLNKAIFSCISLRYNQELSRLILFKMSTFHRRKRNRERFLFWRKLIIKIWIKIRMMASTSQVRKIMVQGLRSHFQVEFEEWIKVLIINIKKTQRDRSSVRLNISLIERKNKLVWIWLNHMKKLMNFWKITGKRSLLVFRRKGSLREKRNFP